MAKATVSKNHEIRTLTKEEALLLDMYRSMRSRWERSALLLIVQSLSWGRLNKKTDQYSWNELIRALRLPRIEVRRG